MSKAPKDSSGKASEADWLCPDPKCGNLNFARRTHCNRCGKEQAISSEKRKLLGTEIGKAAAEKSHGLFSAEDWQCNKCGNVNWARRGTCNMCNAPKVGEVEERTGYGGGFNERTGVEYIQREDSDDEFDEYGRKKKKFRGKSDSVSSSTSKKKSPSPARGNKEDEDEEDGDDDGDLSKYALWSDDEDNDAATKTGDSISKETSDIVGDERKANGSRSSTQSRSRSSSRSRSRDCKRRSSSSSERFRSCRRSSSSRRSRSRSRDRDGGGSSSSGGRHGNGRDHRRTCRDGRRGSRSRSRSRSPRHRSSYRR